MSTDEPEQQTERSLSVSRRTFLGMIGAGSAGTAAALNANQQANEEMSIGGSSMAIDKAYEIAGNYRAGPQSARPNAADAEGMIWEVTDAGPNSQTRRTMSDGSSWITLNVEAESITTEREYVKKEPVANVKAWGAKGDGVTNDTQPIQDALAFLKAEGGGSLFFPAGEYVVCEEPSPTRTFDLSDKPNIEVCGVGNASVIKAESGVAQNSDNGVIIFYGGDNAAYHHLRIDGQRSTQGTITDQSDGANLVGVGHNTVVHDIWSVNSTGDGVEAYGDNVRIHDNHFINNEEQDIHVYGNNTTVTGNVCINCKEDGAIRIFTANIQGGDVDGVRIENNIIRNPATSGIVVYQKVDDGVVAENVTIANNTIISAGDHGIDLGTAIEPEIHNNRIINPTNVGVRCVVNTTNPLIRDNVIKGAGGNCVEIVSLLSGRVRRNEIHDGAARGISVNVDDAGSNDIQITENHLKGNSQEAVNLTANGVAVDRPIIDGNEIGSSSSTQHTKGIAWFVANGGTVTDARVVGNRIKGTVNEAVEELAGVTFGELHANYPRVPIDVRQLENPTEGQQAYHDGTNTNTVGEAQYIGTSWTSLVDGTTIA